MEQVLSSIEFLNLGQRLFFSFSFFFNWQKEVF